MNNTSKAHAKVSLFFGTCSALATHLSSAHGRIDNNRAGQQLQTQRGSVRNELNDIVSIRVLHKMIYFHILRDNVNMILKFWSQMTRHTQGVHVRNESNWSGNVLNGHGLPSLQAGAPPFRRK